MIATFENGVLKFIKADTKKARKRPLAKIFMTDFVSAVKGELEAALGCAKYPFQHSLNLPMTRLNDAVRLVVTTKLEELGQADAAEQVLEHEGKTLVSNALIHKIADLAIEQLRREAGPSYADQKVTEAA